MIVSRSSAIVDRISRNSLIGTHVSETHIAFVGLFVPFGRIAESAASRRRDAHTITSRHAHTESLGPERGFDDVSPHLERNTVQESVTATGNPTRSEP
jgi:hypothetical protein